MAFLKALLIGKARQYGSVAATDELGKAWRSAIFKNAQTGEIYAGELGFEGDEVADTKHHGGVNKAVFANSLENYPAWEAYLGLKNLPLGAMGENLDLLPKFRALEALPASWQDDINRRLNGSYSTAFMEKL